MNKKLQVMSINDVVPCVIEDVSILTNILAALFI